MKNISQYIKTVSVYQFWVYNENADNKGEFPYMMVGSCDEFERVENEVQYTIKRHGAINYANDNGLEFREIKVDVPVEDLDSAFSK